MKRDVISRFEWNAAPPSGVDPMLNHPIMFLYLSYVKNEENFEEMNALKYLQRRDMEAGHVDIQSNFIVHQQGKVYEGRGWMYCPGNVSEFPERNGQFLNICLLGDYSNIKYDTYPGIMTLARVLEMGVQKRFISPDATFIGHYGTPDRPFPEALLEDEDPPDVPTKQLPRSHKLMRSTAYKYLSRADWGALAPVRQDPPLQHPLRYVSVSYIEAPKVALQGDEALKALQRRDIKNGLADVRPNFVVMADGTVYEGRGWMTSPGNQNDHPGKEYQFLEITSIGDFTTDEMNHPVYFGLGSLLEIGLDKNYIHKDAVMIGDESEPEDTSDSSVMQIIPRLLGKE